MGAIKLFSYNFKRISIHFQLIVRYCAVFAGLLYYQHSNGQEATIQTILKEGKVDTVDVFDLAFLNEDYRFIRINYGQRFLKVASFKNLDINAIEEVALVYTAFPPNNNQWQYRLNKNRIKELLKRYPSLRNQDSIKWRFIEQHKAKALKEAKDQFHGFVFKLVDGTSAPDFSNEETLVDITESDSTVYKVLERHPDWSKMLVITDLTASMTPYTAQLLLWFKLNEKKKNIEYFVFFNDGDDKFTSEKTIGNTGGIYGGRANSFEASAFLAQKTIQNGFGGDMPENDLESIIYGINQCPECEEVILIADNRAGPRDMVLLTDIQKPVRVTLCGTEDGINADYLNIAYQTGGSVHTIEKDIENLIELSEGESLQIGDELFVIRNGKFVFLKKI